MHTQTLLVALTAVNVGALGYQSLHRKRCCCD
jgi:hypothetical protein